MKKLIISALALAVFTVVPAHALSEGYRAQLEKSGCDDYTVSHGCNINKSKAWNAKHAPKAPKAPVLTAKQQYGQVVGDAETLLGMKVGAATVYLLDHNWREVGNNEWSKFGHTLRIVEKDGVIANGQIVK